MIKAKQHKVNVLGNKIRFAQMWNQGEISLRKSEIVRLLESYNFDKIYNEDYFLESKEVELNNNIGGYDYLMSCLVSKEEEVIS